MQSTAPSSKSRFSPINFVDLSLNICFFTTPEAVSLIKVIPAASSGVF
ncbi:hypothetical protein [Rickettsia endosymbiont of Gonocerus acuteangulatus]